MKVFFRKMHGLGNDFVVMDERAAVLPLSPRRIAALMDRRRGIGADQFVLLSRPVLGDSAGEKPADVFVRFFNPDGGEAGACGNASRCVAAVIEHESGRPDVSLQTWAGRLAAVVERSHANGAVDVSAIQVTVDMGQPRTGWQDIPLVSEQDTLHMPLDGDPASVSMGNPHVTFFVDDLEAARAGPDIETHPLFPERVNVGFARIDAPDRMRLRVWERGAGFTLACGTGACAAVVNAARRGLGARRMVVEADGGELVIEWRRDGHVLMTGPAVQAFEGFVDLEDFPT